MKKITNNQQIIIDEMLRLGHRNNYYVNGYFLELWDAVRIFKDLTKEWNVACIEYALRTCDNEILRKVKIADVDYIIPTNKFLNNKNCPFN